VYPFQEWEGKLPWNVVFPFKRCLLLPSSSSSFLLGKREGEGEGEVIVPCASDSVQLLLRWNGREYGKEGCIALPLPPPTQGRKEEEGEEKEKEEEEEAEGIKRKIKGLEKRGFASFGELIKSEEEWETCKRRRSSLTEK
jgi:hypothetical protein